MQVVVPEIDGMESTVKEKKMYNANAFLRDVAHVVEYATFAFFVGLLAFTFKLRYGRYPIPIMLVLLFCFVFAIGDELLQGSFDGRMAQFSDVAMDMLGVVMGLAVACCTDLIGIHIIRRKTFKIK